ncbi:unnamed protein product [Merluccius merluccius]
MICGGFGGHQPANEEVQQLCDKVKASVENVKNTSYEVFLAVTYKSQVVAGTNFDIKVHVGGEDHINIRVFRPLPCHNREVELTAVDGQKVDSKPILGVPELQQQQLLQ